nr:hypothetical protein BaRGS_000582 [Batillaria attramentaria]
MMPEEFFFRKQLGAEVKRPTKTWKDNGVAERIFDDLKEKTPQAYQDLIRGMARYLQTDKAFQLYDEMVEKKMPVDLLTYNELIRREFELRHVDDVEFFVNAMKICCQNLHDVELAFRVDELLNTGDNAALLGDSRLVNIYYSFFLRLVFTFETLDTIMDVYQRVTPHLWTPNLTVLEELLKAIELQDGYRHLPLIWTDLLLFEFLRREDLLERLLQLMAKQKQEPDLQRQYAHIAGQLIQRWNEEREAGRDPVLSTGHMVSHILAIAKNAGDHDLAWTMFDIYRKNKNAFSGTPTDSSLQRLVSGCLERGDGERAVAVVNFMNTLDMAGVGDVAQSVLDSDKVALTEQQREILASL